MRSFLFFIFIIVLSINANANTISKVKNIQDIEWIKYDWEDTPESLANDKVVWCVTPQGVLSYCYGGTKKLKLEKAEGNYFYLKSGNSCLRAGNKFSMGKCKKSDDFLYEQIVTEQLGGTFKNDYDNPDEGYVVVVFKIKNSNQYIGLGKGDTFYKTKDISDAYGKGISYVDSCLKDSIENLQGEEKVYCTCSFSSGYGRYKKDFDNFLALYPKIKAKLKNDVYYPLACLDAVEAYRELGTMVAESTNETKKIEKTQVQKKSSNKKEEKEIKKAISNKTSNSLDEKGYADCILENMKDVSSDEAAKAIKEACTYKFLSENNNSKTVANSNKNTATYSDNTIGIVSLPSNLSSCGSITTTRFPIFTGC